MGVSRPRAIAPGPIHASDPLPCVKVAYAGEQEAASAGRPFRQRPYRCPKCGKWHVTKHERFKWTDKGRRR